MKTKLFILLVLSLIYLPCSSDDSNNDNEPCYLYSATIVNDENDCDCNSILCSTLVFVSEEEYNRLLFIKANSNGICPLVDVTTSVTGDVFNGYLVSIIGRSCPDFTF